MTRSAADDVPACDAGRRLFGDHNDLRPKESWDLPCPYPGSVDLKLPTPNVTVHLCPDHMGAVKGIKRFHPPGGLVPASLPEGHPLGRIEPDVIATVRKELDAFGLPQSDLLGLANDIVLALDEKGYIDSWVRNSGPEMTTVSADSAEELEAELASQWSEGWRLHGPLVPPSGYTKGQWAQAIIRGDVYPRPRG